MKQEFSSFTNTPVEKFRTFKDLLVWRKGIELVKLVYKITRAFPKEEQFGLVSQMKRSAVSVPSNIAEGFRRRYSKEQKQFLSVVLGSCAELETQCIIAGELGFIDLVSERQILELLNHICGMTVNLSKKM